MVCSLRFAALCPTCHGEVDQGTFEADALREFLAEKTLQFYCGHCATEWWPSEQELKSVEQLLTSRLAPA